MECTVWSSAFHDIHRKAKKVTRLSEGQLHSTNAVFPKKYADLDFVSTQLTPLVYLCISPAPLLGLSHSYFTFKKKKKQKLWNRGRIRELQARTFALVSFYNYPPGGKCLTFLVLIASFINEWGGLAILRFLLDQISHYENRLWILHQYLTLST